MESQSSNSAPRVKVEKKRMLPRIWENEVRLSVQGFMENQDEVVVQAPVHTAITIYKRPLPVLGRKVT